MAENIQIRKATIEDYASVVEFYDYFIDHLYEFEYGPKWQKGIYPSYGYLKEHIEREELIACFSGNKVISAMIVNSEGSENYKNARWLIDLKDGEYLVIHTFGVSPAYLKLGIGRRMVEYVFELGKGKYPSVRLDVLKGNLSANAFFKKIGFVQTDTIPMFYEDTGWTDFETFEYLLD